MDCGKIKKILYDYLKDEVSPAQKTLIKTHLSLCPDCAAELAGISRMKRMFNASQQDAPPGVLKNLRKRFKPGRSPLLWLRPALTASTVLVIALCVFIYSFTVNSKKSALSSFMLDNYDVVDQSYFDSADYEQTSYIYEQDEL
jgi:predicted anti-sigma-YlaC factor YlaD